MCVFSHSFDTFTLNGNVGSSLYQGDLDATVNKQRHPDVYVVMLHCCFVGPKGEMKQQTDLCIGRCRTEVQLPLTEGLRIPGEHANPTLNFPPTVHKQACLG